MGAIPLLVLLTLAAGCTLRTGNGSPVTATVTPASTGAGGAGETMVPVVATVQITPTATAVATTAVPTETPPTTAPPPATATPAPDETATAPATVTPASAPTGSSTIAELVSADPELSRFAEALRQSGIYETLDGTGTYTVFAPYNAAFDTVPPVRSPAISSTVPPSMPSRATMWSMVDGSRPISRASPRSRPVRRCRSP